jgi:hypothetical protein
MLFGGGKSFRNQKAGFLSSQKGYFLEAKAKCSGEP